MPGSGGLTAPWAFQGGPKAVCQWPAFKGQLKGAEAGALSHLSDKSGLGLRTLALRSSESTRAPALAGPYMASRMGGINVHRS